MKLAGLLAGGTGTRMGCKIPKQFMDIAGVPAIIRVMRTFLACSSIDRLIVAIHPDWQEYFLNLLDAYGIPRDNVLLTTGGDTRFRSMVKLVNAAEQFLGKNLSDEDMLLVHDCARVFVSDRILRDNYLLAQKYDMVTTSLPTIDTVLIAEDGERSSSVPRRDSVFLDQGPQTFHIRQFLDLLHNVTPQQESTYIEAGKMFLDQNKRVGIVKGERMNFKLTTPFDVAMAEYLIQKGETLS